MNPFGWLWCLLGAAAGIAHALMLWRGATISQPSLGWAFPRLAITAVVLVCGAWFGAIFATFSGWVIAYFVTIQLLRVRMVH